MNSDFDAWNKLKKSLSSRNLQKLPQFKEREIWWCSIGKNIGFEENGIILSQPKTLSANRLIRRIRFVEPEIFNDICNNFVNLTIKTKPPTKSGESRTANADLCNNYSTRELKSQEKCKKRSKNGK